MSFTPPPDHAVRIARARVALDGLSIGDAFGERFFGPEQYITPLLRNRELPPAPWRWTDDTAMALGVYETLERLGGIEQDALAEAFARRYTRDDRRGYGSGAHMILMGIAAGQSWRDVSLRVFSGGGSMGNGGAMRVAPVGAYFAHTPPNYADVVEHARRSAEVTHAHPEGQAGAIAVAAAAAWAWHYQLVRDDSDVPKLFECVLAHTPAGRTADGIAEASRIPLSADVHVAAKAVGNGSRVTAPDTVPLCIWLAARHLDDYVEAMWQTGSAGGDIDTNCAIVGGIVAMSVTEKGLPKQWLAMREDLGI
jgi:ADP-ribosylglycohydrolase